MFKPFVKKIREKLVFSSSAFIAILAAWFAFALNIAFWRFVFNTIEYDGIRTVVFVTAVPAVMFFLMYLIFNLIVVPRAGKPLVTVLLVLSAVANYVMTGLGIYIDSDMIRNAFETNVREATDLMTANACLIVFFTGIVPAVLVGLSEITFKPFKSELKTRLSHVAVGLGIVVLFGALSYKNIAVFGRNHREGRKLVNTLNYTYSTVKYFKKKIKARHRFKHLDDGAKFVPYEHDRPVVFVLVVGETARAANFSLYDYERKTNPRLEKRNVVAFNNVASCGTATAVSLPCMFSNMSRAKFDVDDAKFTENMLDLLKRGGYDVLWIENDNGCKGVCNRVETKDVVAENDPKHCFGDYCHDEALLKDLRAKLANVKRDTVVVLHMMGSHGPTYYKRYPDRFKVFQPTCDTADIQGCSREAIVNTYDNTILYTDYVVSQAIKELKKYPQYEAGLMYVSDHGESLGENGIYLHGFPYKIAPKEQKEVPMILWLSETMQREDHMDYGCLKKLSKNNSFSHDNLYHTLLALLEIKTDTYDKALDMFDACRTKPLPF